LFQITVSLVVLAIVVDGFMSTNRHFTLEECARSAAIVYVDDSRAAVTVDRFNCFASIASAGIVGKL